MKAIKHSQATIPKKKEEVGESITVTPKGGVKFEDLDLSGAKLKTIKVK